jgi:acyl-coenzyme A synthetase/AMP-(fatty) acid ligase
MFDLKAGCSLVSTLLTNLDLQILQLASKVANLSNHLKSLGLRLGDRVVLSFPPGLEFFVAFLACITQGYIAGIV